MANNVKITLSEKTGRMLISIDPKVKGEPTKAGKAINLASSGGWLKLDDVDDSLAGHKLMLMLIKPIAKAPAKKVVEEAAGFDDMELPELKAAAKERGIKFLPILKSAPNERIGLKRLRLALEEYDEENGAPEANDDNEDAGETADYEPPKFLEVREQIKQACECTSPQAKAIYNKLCEDEFDWDSKPSAFKKAVLAAHEELHGEPEAAEDNADPDEDEVVEREAADDDEAPVTKPRGKKTVEPVAKTASKRAADIVAAKRKARK